MDPAYVTLALVPGIGPARLAALLARFRSAARALDASFGELLDTPTMTRAAATAVQRADPAATHRLAEELRALDGVVLTPDHPRFPPALTEIPDRPTLLFAAGNLDLLNRQAVAIVGSREHTRYGTHACRHFASAAAAAGLVVVSGMARGLDAIAHHAALDACGGSIGILGNGLGVVYPSANRKLYDRMQVEGCLLTEFPPGERPTAGSFARRNRLISGLAPVTLVVEAGAKSGALITVESALQQGREVLAVPGPITSPASVGCNRLIQAGATPALSTSDLLELYQRAAPPRRTPPAESLSAREQQVLGFLGAGERHVDAIAERLEVAVPETLGILTTLELRGLVSQDPGKWFRRTV